MRSTIIAGNWKMYKTAKEAEEYMHSLMPLVQNFPFRILLAVPFTAISTVAKMAKNSSIEVGAQNMSDAIEGAFTGEVSAKMIKEAGAKFVILGHSERRNIFKEDNAFICRKIKRALAEGITPLLCVGESEQEREQGKTQEVLVRQLEECLKDIPANEIKKIIIAYEPVWAIGTGKTATPEIAQDAHLTCRKCIAKNFGQEIAELIPVLYGGSVKPEHIGDIVNEPDIDGALVGGASLNASTFAQIVSNAEFIGDSW